MAGQNGDGCRKSGDDITHFSVNAQYNDVLVWYAYNDVLVWYPTSMVYPTSIRMALPGSTTSTCTIPLPVGKVLRVVPVLA